MDKLTVAEQLLENLVHALNDAFISCWQSTHYWREELTAAEEYLKERANG